MPFDILVKQNATVDDTLRLIVNAANNCSNSPFVRQLVEKLGLHDLKSPFPDHQNRWRREKIKRLFDYVCRNAKYELDIPGIEEVWTPEKVIREGKFDCKKVTVLLSSVLKAAGIEPVMKHVYYRGPDGSLENFTHIYVIVPDPDLKNYITVDPTNNCNFDKEVEHSKATLYTLSGKKMELHMMGRAPGAPVTPGLDTSSFQSAVNQSACKVEDQMREICDMRAQASNCYNSEAETISGQNQYFSFTTAQNLLHIANVASPVFLAVRASFLTLVFLGKALRKYFKIHFAGRMAKAWAIDKARVRKTWWLLGGTKDATALMKAIIHGTGQQISGPYSYANDKYIGIAPVAIPGAVIAAAPAIKIFMDLFKDLGILKEGETDPAADADLPAPPPPPGPSAGSFATGSIDTFNDLLNFCKASGVILLGASMQPALIIPTNIIVFASFIYAIRKKLSFA